MPVAKVYLKHNKCCAPLINNNFTPKKSINPTELRIIHIVENLDKGAVENWLVNVFLESIKTRPNWDWTFYCILGNKGRLDEKVLAAGGKIIYSPVWISQKRSFLQHLRNTLKTGRFDILHSHHDYLSGFYLLASAGLSFKKRILHIHNTDKALPVGSRRVQKILLPFFRRLAIRYSDLIVGISKDTLNEFVQHKKFRKKKATVLYYGIDLSPYAVKSNREELKKEWDIPANGRILLYTGRMTALKNPVFVIDILQELKKLREDTYAVFVGKGELEDAVIQKSTELGLTDNVRMLGWRNDIAAIMQAADVFVFPRIEYPKEGLGLVVVEAQAAGLPMVISNGIVEDAIEIKDLVSIVSLNNNPTAWAKAVDILLNESPPIDRSAAFNHMQQSRFALHKATNNLIALYE
jgi:glycosyltransferase involved in cell wall biosynthesis